MPGAARAPETLAPVQQVLDVVTLDHQRPTSRFDPADTGRATGLVQMPLIEQRIGLGQHRQHGGFFFAADGAQGKRAPADTE
ncbi:hypothetical protein D3C86_2095980 [compost metagenome]